MKRLLIVLICALASGCSTFRAAMRDLGNADLVGKPAPALSAGEWVGDEPLFQGDWYLVCFLLPL